MKALRSYSKPSNEPQPDLPAAPSIDQALGKSPAIKASSYESTNATALIARVAKGVGDGAGVGGAEDGGSGPGVVNGLAVWVEAGVAFELEAAVAVVVAIGSGMGEPVPPPHALMSNKAVPRASTDRCIATPFNCEASSHVGTVKRRSMQGPLRPD
jgi:hypothetical protein